MYYTVVAFYQHFYFLSFILVSDGLSPIKKIYITGLKYKYIFCPTAYRIIKGFSQCPSTCSWLSPRADLGHVTDSRELIGWRDTVRWLAHHARGPPWLRRPTKTDTPEQHKTTEHIPVYSYRIMILTANVGLLWSNVHLKLIFFIFIYSLIQQLQWLFQFILGQKGQ